MNEAHQRFHDWLTAGAEDDPPRDIAVHASLCAGCQASIAALDALAVVDPGLASMPAPPTGAERGRLALAGRLAGATGVLVAAFILGVGFSQFLGTSRSGGPVAQASATAEQSVLSATATPQPSPEATATPAPTPQETLTLPGTPAPTHRPPVVTPAPIPTAPPTPIPTAPPTPIPTAPPTPPPTASPSASPTEPPPSTSPSAPPTLAPTPTPTPTPTDTDLDGVSDADETLYGSNPNDPNSKPESNAYAASTCTDLVDNDLDGNIDALDTGCQ